MKKPLIINLCGAPGAGKSTGAAYIFSKLKMNGINAELITEFAKDKTWEHNKTAIDNQVYLFAKQYYKITRCSDQVDVIVTDSPILLSIFYGKDKFYAEELKPLILKIWHEDNNILYFVNRDKPYNSKGRFQTEKESDAIAVTLKEILAEFKGDIIYQEIMGNEASYDFVVDQVLKMLEEDK